MKRIHTQLITAALLTCGSAAHAQGILIEEHFTGGMSNAGFTIEAGAINDCDWVYAPGAIGENNFNMNGVDTIPYGGGFDSDFVFVDSDECTASTSNTVETYLVSPAFDASTGLPIHVTFDHQFRDYTGSTATVQVFNGTVWTNVAMWEDNIGYPNPPVAETINITAAAGGSAVAKVRFKYAATWDWWWAIDNIIVRTDIVGLDEVYAQHALKVFPNPTKDVLNIRLDGYQAYGVSVLDATGRVVLEQRMTGSLDVSALTEGMYSIVLRDHHGKRIARTSFVKH
jgi:hypothetical protein